MIKQILVSFLITFTSFTLCAEESFSSHEHYLHADSLINQKHGEYSPQKAFEHLLKGVYISTPVHPKTFHELGLMFHYWPMWNQHYQKSLSNKYNDVLYLILGKRSDFYLEFAFRFYYQAMKLNNPESFSSLGMMYLNGEWVSRNVVEAFKLFSVGDYLGDPISHAYMNNIENYLWLYQKDEIYTFQSQFIKNHDINN